jgi:hypothetical protein
MLESFLAGQKEAAFPDGTAKGRMMNVLSGSSKH